MSPAKKNPAAVSLGRLGGKVKSAIKAKSSAENGRRGGRPRLLPYEHRGIDPDTIDIDDKYGLTYTLTDGVEVECPPQGGVWITPPAGERRQVSGHCDTPYRSVVLALSSYKARKFLA